VNADPLRQEDCNMKQLIQRVANKCGYRIGRISEFDAGDPFKAMQRLLKGIEQPIIFDVGAHRGDVSRQFRSLFPKALIYAFEPFPESFGQLRANTESDANLHAFNFGLSNCVGSQTFHCNSDSVTNSLFPTDKAGADTWGRGLLETTAVIEAQFETLDSVVATNQIPRIDILKLDVQGAEPLVIAGSAATCKRRMIGLIYSEIIIQPTYAGQKRFDEALATFYDNGFDLYDIYNLSYTNGRRLRQVDAIFTARGN
jgi:FkbM family methyltransferase